MFFVRESTIRNEEEKVYLYIDHRDEGNLVVDFFNSNSFSNFAIAIGVPNDWEENGSMMILRNYRGRRVQQGVIYEVNSDALAQIGSDNIQSIEDSLVLAYSVDIGHIEIDFFLRSAPLSRLSRIWMGVSDLFPPPLDFSPFEVSATKVVVRRVGQGSWNELYEKDEVRVVFDMGTRYQASRTEVLRLVGNRDKVYQDSCPAVFISHWDVDHYHCLLGVSDDTIKSIRALIYRNSVPTLTARKVLGRFRTLGNLDALFPVNCETRPRYTRGVVTLRPYVLNGVQTLVLYNAQRVRNRNKSGMALLVRNANKSIVFGADLHYDQIDHSILPSLNYVHDHYLVVPHHGGHAGRYRYQLPLAVNRLDAIVSVGTNSYGHPNRRNLDDLRNNGFRVVRTDFHGRDYEIVL